jgi:hypothetical protein
VPPMLLILSVAGGMALSGRVAFALVPLTMILFVTSLKMLANRYPATFVSGGLTPGAGMSEAHKEEAGIERT